MRAVAGALMHLQGAGCASHWRPCAFVLLFPSVLAPRLAAPRAGGPGACGRAELPAGLSRDQLLSVVAACHLLRVGQTVDNPVTDATVIAAVQRYRPPSRP